MFETDMHLDGRGVAHTATLLRITGPQTAHLGTHSHWSWPAAVMHSLERERRTHMPVLQADLEG